MHLDAATILLQWAAGGLMFLWVTTRGRLVSLGYGWLLRGVFATLGVGAVAAELRTGHAGAGRVVFLVGSASMVGFAFLALVVRVVRRAAGVGDAHAARVIQARVESSRRHSISSRPRVEPSGWSVRPHSPAARCGSPCCG